MVSSDPDTQFLFDFIIIQIQPPKKTIRLNPTIQMKYNTIQSNNISRRRWKRWVWTCLIDTDKLGRMKCNWNITQCFIWHGWLLHIISYRDHEISFILFIGTLNEKSAQQHSTTNLFAMTLVWQMHEHGWKAQKTWHNLYLVCLHSTLIDLCQFSSLLKHLILHLWRDHAHHVLLPFAWKDDEATSSWWPQQQQPDQHSSINSHFTSLCWHSRHQSLLTFHGPRIWCFLPSHDQPPVLDDMHPITRIVVELYSFSILPWIFPGEHTFRPRHQDEYPNKNHHGLFELWARNHRTTWCKGIFLDCWLIGVVPQLIALTKHNNTGWSSSSNPWVAK